MDSSVPEGPERQRATPISGEAFEKLRRQKGMTYRQLAAASGISEKTLRGLRSTERLREKHIGSLTAVFGVPRDELVLGTHPAARHQTAIRSKRQQVDVTVMIDLKDLDVTKQDNVKRMIRRVISGNYRIDIKNTMLGTTLTLEMAESDILRLLAAMLDGDFDLLQMTRFRINNYDWLMTILAVLEDGKGKWTQYNEQAMSDLKWYRAFSSLGIKSPRCCFCKALD